MNWRRFDTLYMRLFLLMWAALVLSHFITFALAVPIFGGPPLRGPGLGHHGPPPGIRVLDDAVRMVVIAIFAALGARWLAKPVARLSWATGRLARALGEGKPLPTIEEDAGTREVRQAARVFNQMARRLQEQFDARSLHMAAVSHDLRTPLTRMRMRLEELEPSPARSGCVADIQEMNELIDNSLEVLREQREGAPPGTVDLQAMLQALADDQTALGHPFSADDVPAVKVRAHPAGLRRVLGNLVNNAVRHAGAGRLQAAVSGDEVEVTVDDDGPGIPPGQLEYVFQPWVRLESGLRQRAGHGLGLAIAKDLVERDGGSLVLENRPGGGLRARLVLQRAP